MKEGLRGGIVLNSPEGFKLYQACVFTFNHTNNEALIGGIRLAKAFGS